MTLTIKLNQLATTSKLITQRTNSIIKFAIVLLLVVLVKYIWLEVTRMVDFMQ